MTKFEKTAKRVELLGVAYHAIIESDRWDNYEESWADNRTLRNDRTEEHEFYMAVAKEIENIL